jgi:hypothetical protein
MPRASDHQSGLTIEHLRALLAYDPATGLFTWLVAQSRRNHVGDVAGAMRLGYRAIQIDGRHYCAHRLAWFYVHGRWPVYEIDHVNGVKADNRLLNLREATSLENKRNRKRCRRNTSGFKGVSAIGRKWRAKIRTDEGRIYLGRFDTPEEAYAARCAAAQQYHGEFARFE